MPEVPADLEDCSTDERIAALLYLGWTHEEIAAATTVSKGTVQNRRKQLESGNLYPPPEAFDLIRTREREIHRLARNSQHSPDALGTELADRMKMIADLETLDIGPDGEISFEELVAFAVLIAGQVPEFTKQEVVKRLALVAISVVSLSDPSESVFDSSRLPGKEPFKRNDVVMERNLSTDNYGTQVQPAVDDSLGKSTSRSKDSIDTQSLLSQQPDFLDHEQPFDRPYRDEQAIQHSKETSCNEAIALSLDREECSRRGGNYVEERGICLLKPSEFER